MEEGCALDVREHVINSAVILPARTMVGGRFLGDLRKQKDVVIPEGVTHIGERWFRNTGVESVALPASITVIEREAFRGCKNLRRVAFAEGSRLEKLGSECFREAGVERVVIPKSVTEILGRAFYVCKDLKKVTFEKGSSLQNIGAESFYMTGLKRVAIPKGVTVIQCDAFCGCRSLKEVTFE